MKKFCLIAVLMMASLAAKAQTHINIVAAPQFDASIGVRAGADFDFSLGKSKFSLVPGLYWSMRNYNGSQTIITSGESYPICDVNDKSHWITIPLRFAYNIKKGSEKLQTQILFGPYVAFGLGGTTKVTDLLTGEKTRNTGSFDKDGFYDRRFDLGLNAGANFIIHKHFVVGIFGELGFLPLGNDVTGTISGIFASTILSIHLGAGLNLGYRF